MRTNKLTTMLVTAAVFLAGGARGSSAATLVELPVNFKLTVTSQVEVTNKANTLPGIERTRMTNKDILAELGLPTSSQIVVRVDQGKMEVFAGTTNVTEQLGGLLWLKPVASAIDIDLASIDLADPEEALRKFIAGLNKQGAVVQLTAKGSEKKGSATAKFVAVESAEGGFSKDSSISGQSLVQGTVKASVNTSGVKLSSTQTGQLTGLLMPKIERGPVSVVTGTWTIKGKFKL